MRLEGRDLPAPFVIPPTLFAGGNVVIDVGDTITRVGTWSDADPAAKLTGLVNWGDGPTQLLPLNAGGTFTLSHGWAATGSYVVQVELVDAAGAEAFYGFSATVTRELPAPAPTPAPTGPISTPPSSPTLTAGGPPSGTPSGVLSSSAAPVPAASHPAVNDPAVAGLIHGPMYYVHHRPHRHHNIHAL
jgi:hypothetical protein